MVDPLQIPLREMLQVDGGEVKCVDCASPAAVDRKRCLWHLGQQRQAAQRLRDKARPGEQILADDWRRINSR